MGFTHAPVEHTLPIQIGNIFGAFDSHVDGMARYIGLTIPLRNVRNALKTNNGALHRELVERMGTAWIRRLTQTTNNLAGSQVIHQGVGKVIANLSSNVMRSVLAWNPGPYWNNRLPGSFLLAAYIAKDHPKAASIMLAHLAHPTLIKTTRIPLPSLPSTQENMRILDFLMEHGYLGDRWAGDYSHIASPVARGLVPNTRSKVAMVVRHWGNESLNPMMHAEQRNAIMAFKGLVAEGVSERETRTIIANGTRATQNSSSDIDDSPFIQDVRESTLGGLFPFLSQNVTARNFLIEQILDGSKKGIALAALGLSASLIATVMIHAFLRSLRAGPDDDKDKAEEMALLDGINQSMDTVVPGSGQVMDKVFSAASGTYLSGGGLIIQKPLDEIAYFAGNLLNDKPVDMDKIVKVIKAATQLMGLPVGGLYSVFGMAKGLATDYEPTTDAEKTRRAISIIHNTIHDRTYSRGQSDSQADILRQTLIRKGLIKPTVTEGEFKGRVWRHVKAAESR